MCIISDHSLDILNSSHGQTMVCLPALFNNCRATLSVVMFRKRPDKMLSRLVINYPQQQTRELVDIDLSEAIVELIPKSHT